MSGLELKLKRIEAGIKQYQLASTLGVSPTYLCEIEMGRRRPSNELIKRIVALLNHEQQNTKELKPINEDCTDKSQGT
jgi:transcriptional regulator with XRE-family HTH domain